MRANRKCCRRRLREWQSAAWLEIKSLDYNHPCTTDLLRVGFHPGRRIRIGVNAPLGCPVMVCLDDAWFVLRRSELEAMELDVCEAGTEE